MSRRKGGEPHSQRRHICRESRETQVHAVRHGEDLRILSPARRAESDGCTFSKLDEIPIAWFPKRRSHAMATQSFPTMAITEPPLYSIIDY